VQLFRHFEGLGYPWCGAKTPQARERVPYWNDHTDKGRKRRSKLLIVSAKIGYTRPVPSVAFSGSLRRALELCSSFHEILCRLSGHQILCRL